MDTHNPFLDYNTLFVTFGAQHLLMMGLIVAASVAVPLYASRALDARRRLLVARVLAVVLALTIVLWVALRMALGDFEMTTDLPLDVCNLAAFLMPFLMWNPTRRVHEVLYFLVLVGTLQAVLTPHLFNGFPNFTFFKYWIVHGGLIVYVIYITVGFKYYPDRRSLVRAFVWLNLYAVAVVIANALLGSNYFYIMRKPPTASLLDVLGPWPWYIVVCEGLVLVLFVLVYLPVLMVRKRGVSVREDSLR